MIELLTKKEAAFLTKLASLLEEYGVLISCMGEDGVEILVYENEDTVHNPIKFYHDFDETDIRDLFEATSKQAKAVVEAHNADIYVMPKEKG